MKIKTYGHNLEESKIFEILSGLGATNIQNNHYNIRYPKIKSLDGSIPDFICKFNKLYCAVEIGNINYKDSDKITKLIYSFDCVIHIYHESKSNYILVNSYTRDNKFPKEIKREYFDYNKEKNKKDDIFTQIISSKITEKEMNLIKEIIEKDHYIESISHYIRILIIKDLKQRGEK